MVKGSLSRKYTRIRGYRLQMTVMRNWATQVKAIARPVLHTKKVMDCKIGWAGYEFGLLMSVSCVLTLPPIDA